MHHVVTYIKWSPTPDEPYDTLRKFGSWLSFVVLNSSFLLVLGLILTQFIAITYPHHYRSVVTKRRVLALISVSLVYFPLFIPLQFFVFQNETLIQIDLHLHSTLIKILQIIGSAMLLRSYRQYTKASISRRFEGTRGVENRDPTRSTMDRASERQFTIIITLLLSGIFIVCSLPHIILLHIRLYMNQESLQKKLDLRSLSGTRGETGCLHLRVETNKIPKVFENSTHLSPESGRTRRHWNKHNNNNSILKKFYNRSSMASCCSFSLPISYTIWHKTVADVRCMENVRAYTRCRNTTTLFTWTDTTLKKRSRKVL